MGVFKRLAWESEFFGIPMLAMEPPQSDGVPREEELRATNAAVIDCELPARAIAVAGALCDAGFFLCDTAIKFTVCLSEKSRPQLTPQISIRTAEHADEASVVTLGMTLGFRSRFCRYPFDPTDGQRFYAAWISNAIAGRFDDICLVAGTADAPAGLLTLRRAEESRARVGLFGVRPEWRGRGVAEALWMSGAAWAMGENRSIIDIATQMDNLPAIRLYRKIGGRATDESLRFYWVAGGYRLVRAGVDE